MAIAPSKIGTLIHLNWSDTAAIVTDLRAHHLVDDVDDSTLIDAVEKARSEDRQLPPDRRQFNTPHERARVFLGPSLNEKGRRWATPLHSLDAESTRWTRQQRTAPLPDIDVSPSKAQ
jgi:hypothetical protein